MLLRMKHPLPFRDWPRAEVTEEDWTRLSVAVETKAAQVARLARRLRRAGVSLRDAIDAVHEAVRRDNTNKGLH